MDRDDIIRMAREAHLDVYGLGKDRKKFVSVVERFADLVAAAEREECAEVCKTHAKVYTELPKSFATEAAWAACDDLLAAIRARGQE